MNRWLCTCWACKNAIDPEFKFKSALYYLVDTTDLKFRCCLLKSNALLDLHQYSHPVLGAFSIGFNRWFYSGYERVPGCQCQRDWGKKKDSKKALQLMWLSCMDLDDPLKGVQADLSTQVQLHMIAEVKFSVGSPGVYASTKYAEQYGRLGREFEKIRQGGPCLSHQSSPPCGVYLAGKSLDDIIGGSLPHERWSRCWSVGWFTNAVRKMPTRTELQYAFSSTAELMQQILPTNTMRHNYTDSCTIM